MKFSRSCKTLALKQELMFISAFPGFLVFGEVDQIGYKDKKFFKFAFYQIFELYLALINVIKYFVLSNEVEHHQQGRIIKINEKLSYYWLGKLLKINNEDEKTVIFVIELNNEKSFQLLFTSEELNDFVKTLSEMILPCLCLKNLERELLENASKLMTSDIVSLNNRQNSKKFVQKFLQEQIEDHDLILEPNLTDTLLYYNEITLLLQKINTLINSEINLNQNERLQNILDA